MIDIFRRLPSLTHLRYSHTVNSAELNALTAEPHQLKLKSLNLSRMNIDAGYAACLARLPTLTSLQTFLISTADPSFIFRLTQLQTVSFNVDEGEEEKGDVDVDLLISALAQCTLIRSLNISHSALSHSHYTILLPSLTHLSELTLNDLPLLTSLSFLSSTPHLAHTLSSLTLTECHSLPLSELSHVSSLRHLTRLTIDSSFTAPLDKSTRSRLNPASPHFRRTNYPLLRTFTYIAQ